MNMVNSGRIILKGESRNTRRQPRPSVTSTINHTQTCQGANPGLRCKRMVTDRLRRGKAS